VLDGLSHVRSIPSRTIGCDGEPLVLVTHDGDERRRARQGMMHLDPSNHQLKL